jgi:predicted  nucleic acid-binding Zn-ribbon protein
VSANRDSIAIHTLQRKWADAEVRAEAAESALQVARDERDEARSEVDDKSEVGHRVADAWQAKAEAAESSLRVARDALREIMVTARDLTAGRSDDAVLVEVADIAASALLAQEVSPNG